MKKTRFTDEQTIGLPKPSESREGIPSGDDCQNAAPQANPLGSIEAEFLAAEGTGRLAQAVRQTEQASRSQNVSTTQGISLVYTLSTATNHLLALLKSLLRAKT